MRQRAAEELFHSCVLVLPLLLTRLAAKQVLLYRAAEEGPRNLRIGNVASDLGVAVGSEEVTFSLESGFDYLKINNFTGELSTSSQRIDRERLQQCQLVFDEKECFIEFEVSVIGPAQSWVNLLEGRLVILDINDNTPSFPSPVLSLSVEENQPIGTLYLLPTATDPDFGRNAVQRYELLQGGGHGRGRGRGRSSVFELQVADTPEGGKQPQLIVKGDLDRERRESYDLILRACDGGDPPRTAQASLRITVTDTNDNSPRFERAQYEGQLEENTPAGVSVLRVRALDLDIGLNGEVEYSLAPGPGVEVAGRFLQVEPSSGWISVLQPVDREEIGQLRFAVTARDRGQPPLSATASVLLHVRDLNDNAPAVDIRKIGRIPLRQGLARVPEDVVVDTPVALIQVWDRDEGQNGEVTCTLVGDVPFQLKPAGGMAGVAVGGANGRKYLLHTAVPLDYEAAKEHHLLIVAVDAGSPALTGNSSLTVEVGDVNDHAPLFLQGALEAAVPENNAPGETLVRAEALDADSGRNGEVLYSLDSSAHALFTINPWSGEITANSMLDREQGDRYEFRVWATDRGIPPLQSFVPVLVRVLDLNDNSPAFLHHVFTFYAHENLPAHSPIGMVTATDADEGRNAALSFFIVQDEDEEEDMLFISNTTGMICTRRALDREARAVHRFGVTAVDGGDPPRSCSTTVTLFITDENDNPPQVITPGNTSCSLLPPSSPPHTTVVTVVAMDADEGQNAELQFGLVGGNPFGLFSVDPVGGAVTLVGVLERRHVGLHRLVLQVRDGGSPPLHTTALVHVYVNHTLSNASQVQMAVSRSLLLPLSQDVAGEPPDWLHPQGLSMAIGALAGGVAVLLLILLVVMANHCAPRSRKGYKVGRREPQEERCGAEDDRQRAMGRYSAVREGPGSPDLARHYTCAPPLPALRLHPHSPPYPTHPHLPPANTFVSMATQCHPEHSYQSDNVYSKQSLRRVAISVTGRSQDPSGYDSGLEDSDTPSSTSSTPLAPPPPDLAPPEENHEQSISNGNVGNTEDSENESRRLPDVTMTGNQLPHSAPCCLHARTVPANRGAPSQGHTLRKMTSPSKRMTSWSYDSVRAISLGGPGGGSPLVSQTGGIRTSSCHTLSH
ncbi:protocadherin-7-like [Anguilla rostrata]|uniref:protocadherin-7-like n=1 Tax=Anguilla rostrata TaxID=7938 RepID=UPI0030D262A0